MVHNDTLAPDQAVLLEALLSCPSHTEAAKKAGISRSTLYRMLQDRSLQEAYRQARVAAVKHAISRVQGLTDKAVTELEAILTDRKLAVHARIKVIELVLTSALQGTTLEELLVRIEDLEAYRAEAR